MTGYVECSTIQNRLWHFQYRNEFTRFVFWTKQELNVISLPFAAAVICYYFNLKKINIF